MISALLVARLARRFATFGDTPPDPNDPLAPLTPATTWVVGLLLGYYLRFTLGVLLRARVVAALAA